MVFHNTPSNVHISLLCAGERLPNMSPCCYIISTFKITNARKLNRPIKTLWIFIMNCEIWNTLLMAMQQSNNISSLHFFSHLVFQFSPYQRIPQWTQSKSVPLCTFSSSSWHSEARTSWHSEARTRESNTQNFRVCFANCNKPYL